MTWKIALSNLETVTTDTRITCTICGYKFEPALNNDRTKVKYCCAICKEYGGQISKRKSDLRTKLKKKESQNEMSCM